MVETDRAAAFFMDDILLYSLVASSKAPADYAIGAEAYSVEPYGIDAAQGRPGVPEGRRQRDGAALQERRRSTPIYDKWFLAPIPPKGVNLNVPVSAAAQERVREPDEQRRSGGVQVSMQRPLRVQTRGPAAPRFRSRSCSWRSARRREGGGGDPAMNYNWNWRHLLGDVRRMAAHTWIMTIVHGLGWTLATALCAGIIALPAGIGRSASSAPRRTNGRCASATRTSSSSATFRCSCSCSSGSSCCPSCCRRRSARRSSR